MQKKCLLKIWFSPTSSFKDHVETDCSLKESTYSGYLTTIFTPLVKKKKKVVFQNKTCTRGKKHVKVSPGTNQLS